MFSPDQLDSLMEGIISRLGQGTGDFIKGLSTGNANDGGSIKSIQKKIPAFTPQNVLVILGLLSGVLEVKSVLVDRDQVVDIILEGSLKRPSKLDKCLDAIGAMPFDDVLKAVLGRF